MFISSFFSFHWDKSRIILPYILTLLCFVYAPFAALAQSCYCTPPVYSVGEAVGIPNVTSAVATYGAAFAAPGAVCIEVDGEFEVDPGQTWNLANTRLSFSSPISALIVAATGVLNAQTATFRPCVYTFDWYGISVLTGGQLNMNKSRIFKAGYAGVIVSKDATFHITASTFSNCNAGLRVFGNQNPANHTISGNTFQYSKFGIYLASTRNVQILSNIYQGDSDSNSSMTGIHMESICQNTEILGGNFIFQERGVSANKSEDFVVRGATFRDNIVGIYSLASRDNLIVEQCTFNTKEHAIHSNLHETHWATKGNVIINNNNFPTAVLKSNILLEATAGEGRIEIKKNTLVLPSNMPLGSAPQYGIELDKVYVNEGTLIEDNVITYNTITGSSIATPGGILVRQLTQPNSCFITNNTITNSAPLWTMTNLIDLASSSGAFHVVGNTLDGGVGISGRGISIDNCKGLIQLCCNDLNQTNVGLYVKGPLNGAEIHTTTFNKHPFAALHYDQVTTLTGAPQVNNGNDWSNASGLWDALFQGSAGVASMVNYVVENSFLPNGLSKVSVNGGNSSAWFALNQAIEDACNACGSNKGDGNGERSNIPQGNEQITIFPNPADEYISVQIPTGIEQGSEIRLWDALGRTVLRKTIVDTNIFDLPIEAVTSGLYILEIVVGQKKVYQSTVVVQH